jgi:solute:Na+ symporter, SSS family
MLGLFLLGVFSKQKNVVGAIAGVIAGLGIILWMSLSNIFLSEDALGNQFHTYLIIVFGTSAIFLVGFLFTLFQTKKTSDS